jgi:SAM-dependent methyltransferase
MIDYTPFAELYDLFYDDFDDDLSMVVGFAERAGGQVLEIGAGTGRVTIALAAAGRRVVGLEPSKEMLAIAQRKVNEQRLTDRAAFVQGDMAHFKLDQYFGLIVVPLNTFLHNLTLDDQLNSLHCFKQHLRPGGLLVLDCFNPDPAYAADDRRLLLQRSVIDPATGQTALLFMSRATDWGQQTQEITYVVDRPDKRGQVQRSVFVAPFRCVFRNELQLLLKLAGFDLKDLYGSYELDPFDGASDKLIAVATAG